jgi:hypothetical protein
LIHYHGGPITPKDVAAKFYAGRHAMISFAEPRDIELAAAVCQSFAVDNGAFSFWRTGKQTDWKGYYSWVAEWVTHPGFDWALIPDVIDGDEEQNNALIEEWPHQLAWHGVPVWHLHESLERLDWLTDDFPIVALGSSGEWPNPGTDKWWQRMNQAMGVACHANGRPKAKLHGLRMLNHRIFSQLPLSSADSTNVARNYAGLKLGAVGCEVIARPIEAVQSCERWVGIAGNTEFNFGEIRCALTN